MLYFTVESGFPPHPECFGSKCEACGVGDRPGVRVLRVVSVEVDHQDGRYTCLFLCGLCVQEWAHALDMLTVAESAVLRERVAAAEAEVVSLSGEMERLESVRRAIEAVAPQVRAELEEDADRVPCPSCGKLVKPQGLGAHVRKAHPEDAAA